MYPKNKLVSIFKKILVQTKKGAIEWREFDAENYLADVGEIKLRLQEKKLDIFDSKENLLQSINKSDLYQEEENIGTLFELARNSALKVCA